MRYVYIEDTTRRADANVVSGRTHAVLRCRLPRHRPACSL